MTTVPNFSDSPERSAASVQRRARSRDRVVSSTPAYRTPTEAKASIIRMRRLLSGTVAIGACVTLLAVAVAAFVVEVSLATPLSVVIGALVATAIVAAAGLADLDRMAVALRAAHVFLPILAYLVTVAWIGSTRATVRFDEIGAQVIAVLVLALAIDVRFFRLTADRDRLEVMSTCFVMILLAIGELYALRGVFTGAPEHGEIVAASIAVGFTAVAVSALIRPLRAAAEEKG